MIGQTLGTYRILEKLGEGGMGVVYKAEHVLIGRKAAIKLLGRELSSNEQMVMRFFNEARATSMIEHPGLVDVSDFGYHEGRAYIVMEFLQGETLAARIHRERRLQLDVIASVIRQIAAALGAAHAKGITHRDLKPDNVFLVMDREVASGLRVKVLDFGIAKLMDDAGTSQSQTSTGAVLGTPRYMSPEQCKGAGTVDYRADLYSLGCMIFEMATGVLPFERQGTGELIAAHIFEQPPRPSQIDPSIPPPLEQLILWCLAKDPNARPRSMGEVEASLEAWAPRMTGHQRAVTPIPGGYTPGWPTPVPSHGGYTPPPGYGVPTTLGGATGQSMAGAPPPKKRGALIAVVAGSVLAIGAAVIVVVASGGGGGGKPAVTAASEPPAPMVEPPAAPAAPVEAVVAPAAVAPAAEVTIQITSDPPGADVYRAFDGIRVGQTPLEQKLPRMEADAVLVLRKRGFRDERLEIPLGADATREVTLVKTSGSSGSNTIALPSPPRQPAATTAAPSLVAAAPPPATPAPVTPPPAPSIATPAPTRPPPAPVVPAPGPARTKVVPPSSVTRLSGKAPATDASGDIVAKLCIDDGGRVTSVNVLRAPDGAETAVATALKTWRYKPYNEGGQSVPVCFAMNMKLK